MSPPLRSAIRTPVRGAVRSHEIIRMGPDIAPDPEFLAVNPDDSEMLNPDASPAENPA